MSYDIWLEGVKGTSLGGLDWNYTSNVAPMWRKAMPSTDGLAGLHGMPAGRAAKIVRGGVFLMEKDPGTYRELNPANGWGDFDSQLQSLKELAEACENAPWATVAIWR